MEVPFQYGRLASFRTSPVPFTLEGVPPLPLSPPLTYCRPLSRLDKAKASFALCSLLHRLSQGREKLRISRIPHSQSSGIAREACALKGERCVFMEWISIPTSILLNGTVWGFFIYFCIQSRRSLLVEIVSQHTLSAFQRAS